MANFLKNIFGGRAEGESGDGQAVNVAAGEGLGSLETGDEKEIIGKKEIRRAVEILQKYKAGKANLENTIVENERWYKLRHWEYIRRKEKGQAPEPTSAWLFNAIMNKHADAMDNYPEPVVLPRERDDVGSAKTLSEVLPVVLKYNNFEQVYSDNWWDKLKHGTAVYGVFWNSEKENGLGDIDIKPIDLLKIFWEPGKKKIQDSKNLFIVELADEEELQTEYDVSRLAKTISVTEYIHDENIDTKDKVVVVDWYYKKRVGGKTLLHYVKFCGETVLYASENDPAYRDRGYYDHGLYPVVFDVMFPETEAPVGFGYVAISKDPQLYIDKLMGNILETSILNTKRRFFASRGININKDQLLDNNEAIVEVQGSIADLKTQLLEMQPRELSGIYPNIVQMKIEEMKDTAGNRDVNSGGTGSGVTAASAIVALQEAGNKVSRDMIAASYRNYVQISSMCIELMRQFYDESRSFRIVGAPMQEQGMPALPGQPGTVAPQNGMPMGAPSGTPGGAMPPQENYHFVEFNNMSLRDQPTGISSSGEQLYRRPIFDLEIKAQKKNPFSRAEQNQLALQLFQMGAFNPEAAEAMLGALKLMDFEGIEDVREHVQKGQTLFAQLQQQAHMIAQLQQMLAATQKGAGGAPS